MLKKSRGTSRGRETILERRPELVCAPHVETASGMILPDAYIRAVAEAVHEVGGLFVLDCIASGAIWVDMKACGVDVLISAPQKGWTASPCCGLVMLGDRALARIGSTTSTSFAGDLRKWLEIMQAYEQGGHMYHATMPTDALMRLRDVMEETEDDDIRSGARFAAAGLQTAAGVPLQCDEPADFKTFRLGLFGLDKLHNVERTVAYLAEALDRVL